MEGIESKYCRAVPDHRFLEYHQREERQDGRDCEKTELEESLIVDQNRDRLRNRTQDDQDQKPAGNCIHEVLAALWKRFDPVERLLRLRQPYRASKTLLLSSAFRSRRLIKRLAINRDLPH